MYLDSWVVVAQDGFWIFGIRILDFGFWICIDPLLSMLRRSCAQSGP